MDQGSTKKRSAVHNFASQFDTKFGNSRGEIVDRSMILFDPWSMDPTDMVW